MGDEIECPSCRKPATIPAAGVAALQTNFYAKYIQSLVYGVGALGCSPAMLGEGHGGTDPMCQTHNSMKAQYFCKQCSRMACESCFSNEGSCSGHQKKPLVAAAEDFQGKIDASFARANALIEQKKVELEARLKAFSEEKDRALLKIDAAFEAHVHLLNRRATLLKNKVIDSYNERVTSFESDLEEISTAMTCIISLKEFHETAISRGQLEDIEKGVEELNEVYSNVESRIHPRPYHVLFEDKHGIERFKSCIKDLGKVTCFAGTVASLDQKNSAVASGDDDPPDTTPSSPHPPSSGGFSDHPVVGKPDPDDRRSVDDNEGERPPPDGRRNGSVSDASHDLDAKKLPNTVSGTDVTETYRVSADTTTTQIDKTEAINNNSNRGFVDFLSARLHRPYSARVKKAFEKAKDDENDNRKGDDSDVRNNAKGLASPVRRPKFLISPDEVKANRNKVAEIISSNLAWSS